MVYEIMDDKHLVSIIVPVYQAEEFLERCVLSLLDQTYKNIEIILIDDGSEDKSCELCLNLKTRDNRIKVYHHENQGVSFTRNAGIEYAKGEYLMFLDADDAFDAHMIEEMVYGMKNHGADLCICGFMRVKNKLENCYLPNIKDLYLKKQKFMDYFWLLFDSHILHNIGTKIYRKSLLDIYAIRFRKDFVVCEDILFCLDYLDAAEDIYIVDKPYYHYIQDNINSANKRYRPKFLLNALELNRKLEQIIKNKNVLYYKNIISNVYPAVINEFRNPNKNKEDILQKLSLVCSVLEIGRLKDLVKLSNLSAEEKLFSIFIKKKHIRLLYYFMILVGWKEQIQNGDKRIFSR